MVPGTIEKEHDMERMSDSANSLTGQIAARQLKEKRANDEAEAGRLAAAEKLRLESELADDPNEVLHYTDSRVRSIPPLNPTLM
jgi:hypothetical protein